MGSPHPEQDRSTTVPSAWLPGLAPTSYSCFPFPGAPRLPQRSRCSPSSSCTMQALHGLMGPLLAVAVLVLQPAGSLGECCSPAQFQRFHGSALLFSQMGNHQARKVQPETCLWLEALLISF